MPREALILLASAEGGRALERAGVRIVHCFLPHVVIAELSEEAAGQLQQDDAIAAIFFEQAEGNFDWLDETARLAIEGWNERQLAKSEREGEGKPWDAPGFEAP